MGYLKYIDEIVDGKINALHTAYLAKVLLVNENNTAKIQPLGMIKNAEGKANKQSVLTAVPYVKQVTDIKKNDIAVCICCERDITEAKKGKNAILPNGDYHNMSNSIIIATL